MTGVRRRGQAVAGVVTDRGEITCEILVNCAGMWARDVGRLAGVSVPLHAVEHMHMTTGPIEGVTPDLPVLRDPDGYIYLREEAGGLLMGGFGPRAKPWGEARYPRRLRLHPGSSPTRNRSGSSGEQRFLSGFRRSGRQRIRDGA